MAESVKVSVELTSDDIAVLQEIATRRGSTLTEALRGAVATERYIRSIYARGDHLLIRKRGQGTVRQMILS